MSNKSVKNIELFNIRQNNLKGFNAFIPQKKLTIITGLSGSGKSSLAFETLYAEGQRRYVESLSTYTRQFLEKMPKPLVDRVENIPPAIALEQRNSVQNTRSTVATQTEILDLLRLLFSRASTRYCDQCKSPVNHQTGESLRKEALSHLQNKKFALLARLAHRPDTKGTKTHQRQFITSYLEILRDQGFGRVYHGETKSWFDLNEPAPKNLSIEALYQQDLYVLIDRFNWSKTNAIDDDQIKRFQDSFDQALKYGHEHAVVLNLDDDTQTVYRTGFVCRPCNRDYPEPHPHRFSYQSPLGACPDCNGYGYRLELDPKKIILFPKHSLSAGAIDPLEKPSHQSAKKRFIAYLEKHKIRPNKNYSQLIDEEKIKVWSFIEDFFKDLEEKRYKFHVRIFIRRYQSPVVCTTCNGSRLRPESLKYLFHQRSLEHFLTPPLGEVLELLKSLHLSPSEQKTLKDVFPFLVRRLEMLRTVGVDYLSLNRLTKTLSGGENQRVNLATHLGNGLSGTLYVLDEPTVGLHPKDTHALYTALEQLKTQGNTLVVVEHDPAILKRADHIIEMGPGAGKTGGNLVFSGSPQELVQSRNTARTARVLEESIVPQRIFPLRSAPKKWIQIRGCTSQNLKNINVDFPLQHFCVVSGPSGSGKTTLVHETLGFALNSLFLEDQTQDQLQDKTETEDTETLPPRYSSIEGYEYVDSVVTLDQKPIGKNSRSNPATFIKAWDDIRKIYSQLPLSLSRGYTPQFFSFNVDGGRCPTCKGEGEVTIDLHFMAEVKVRCDECQGLRFKADVLEAKIKGKSVADLLETSVEEIHQMFFEIPELRRKLESLIDVGLGYLSLGQSGPTLSGGEAQRLKIAQVLDQFESKKKSSSVLFILDEPCTGLHTDDVRQLLGVLHKLVDKGHSIIAIEHNLEVIANSDWVIDLGPSGGSAGGNVVAQGSPEQLIRNIEKTPYSATAKALRGDY